MIRNSKPSDRSAIQKIAEAIGFEEAEISEVLFSFDMAHHPDNRFQAIWFIDEDADDIQGVAYVEPERMTESTYNLLFIAVHPRKQKQGRGTSLIRHVEREISARGGRLLIVETMGTTDFLHVRRLYTQLGFVEEARIRDFYADGYEKVIYWKSLDRKV